jgi:P-type Ca2+ transporter type 2C
MFQQPVEILHHASPGRIRLKAAALYRREDAKAPIEQAILGISYVESVRGNPLTGSILIHFNPDHAGVDRVLNDLESILGEISPLPLHHGQSAKRSPSSSQGLGGWLKKKASLNDLRARFTESSDHGGMVAVEEFETYQAPGEAWHTLPATETFEKLATFEGGLSQVEAAHRLQIYGPNALIDGKKEKGLEMLVEQFTNIPVAMLGVSAAVSLATGGVADAMVIVGVVVINALIGYYTEKSAEKTINALGSMRPDAVMVMRDGVKLEIPFDHVVPGDMLILSPGAYIPADARLINANNLTVDESALTGESLPVNKNFTDTFEPETPLGERSNMVHMGTTVTGGNGLAIVTASGKSTEIGHIQSLVGDVETPDTPLQRQLDEMGRTLAISSAGICGLVFAIGVMRGMPWLQMLNSAISLAVAAVPEGLPAVATTTLALGIREMKRRKVLIRHLPAVESLGSVQTICLDKTGTLTMNIMKVVAMKTERHDIALTEGQFSNTDGTSATPSEHHELHRLLEVVSLCSDVNLTHDGMPADGSPTEAALVHASICAGIDVAELRATYPLLQVEHRAEGRPYMASVHETGTEERLVAVKGSPSHVLSLCTEWQCGTERKKLTKALRDRILAGNEELAGDALRVLGVAHGVTTADDSATPKRLVWLGLIGMEDVLRPNTAELMHQFHEAGIETVMITGDQSATAFSVGKRLGLGGRKDIEIMDSTNLDKLEPELLSNIVKDTTIFARVSPAHKLRIVQALQGNGRIIAMTGDGINDGPALKASDIGVAMGEGGTDVARAVADVVLQDDNLHTMISAVEQGRTIYSNIRKSLRFLLSTNLSEIEVMLITTALGFGEALNPMQLLWINLVTDVFPALALAVEPPESDVLQQPPRDPEEKIITREDGLRLLRESMMITLGTVAVFMISQRRYGLGIQTSTNTFMALTIAQILQSIGNRSEKTTILDFDRPGNPWMTAATVGTLSLQALTLVFPPLRTLLRLGPVGPHDIALILAGATAPFIINESSKKLLNTKQQETA